MIKSFIKLLIILVTLIYIPTCLAAEIVDTYQISDKDAIPGDIIIFDNTRGFVRTDVSYSNRSFGVINDEPLFSNRNVNPSDNEHPIVKTSETIVNVNDFNAPIKTGDFVTSSPILGKGMRATLSGYVIGVALENATADKTISFQGKSYKTGQVKVAMHIEYAEISTARSSIKLFEDLNSAFFRNVQDPEKFSLIIRYIIAGIIAIITLILGLYGVIRSIGKGIESMGRNPLARKTIQVSIIIQCAVITLLSLGGLALAVIVIRY